jgi:hypothetical protein
VTSAGPIVILGSWPPLIPTAPDSVAALGGRLSFTPAEVEELRDLIRELRRADRDHQKMIRARMRRIGLYITDVAHDADGFTASDLDDLISRGTIQVQN